MVNKRRNTIKEIWERREKINLLLAKGFHPMDIEMELGISRMTLNRDMRHINEMNDRSLRGMARGFFATAYVNCVEGCNEILMECWRRYKNEENNPRITEWHKVAWLRLAQEVQHYKFNMFKDGPATMHLGTLHEKVEELRRFALEDRTDTFTKRGDSSSPSLSGSPYHDFNVRDLDKP